MTLRTRIDQLTSIYNICGDIQIVLLDVSRCEMPLPDNHEIGEREWKQCLDNEIIRMRVTGLVAQSGVSASSIVHICVELLAITYCIVDDELFHSLEINELLTAQLID